MSEILQWSTGLNGYKKQTLENNNFNTELTECQFEKGRSVDSIFYDHLVDRPSSPVELLYSGGLDSELILMSLLRNKIPVEVMTMVIRIKGAPINVADLYYSEKFCRENNIKQNLFYLDAIDFFKSNQYKEYLVPLNITEPHVATHLWLIEKCQNYPILGGDWPWVQTHKNVISPFKLAYNSYERFMHSKGINGIGNMIAHSFESSYHFMKSHIDNFQQGDDSTFTSSFLKNKMYGIAEPRIRSYGWEHCPANLFNINTYKVELFKQLGAPKSSITWGEQVSTLIGSSTNTNNLFT